MVLPLRQGPLHSDARSLSQDTAYGAVYTGTIIMLFTSIQEHVSLTNNRALIRLMYVSIITLYQIHNRLICSRGGPPRVCCEN